MCIRDSSTTVITPPLTTQPPSCCPHLLEALHQPLAVGVRHRAVDVGRQAKERRRVRVWQLGDELRWVASGRCGEGRQGCGARGRQGAHRSWTRPVRWQRWRRPRGAAARAVGWALGWALGMGCGAGQCVNGPRYDRRWGKDRRMDEQVDR
eukprot:7718-Chlamydomonas_euryale.AAC.3